MGKTKSEKNKDRWEKKKDKQRQSFQSEWEVWSKAKREESEREASGITRKEKPTESKIKEGDERVGGRQGKTGEEREDAEMKERTREERQSGRERAKCQTDK